MTDLFTFHTLRILILIGLATLITACTVVGPDYARPAVALPSAYKETNPLTTKRAPAPALEQAAWWKIYGDKQLNALVDQVETHNQSIQSVEARLRQARALASIARAGQSPTVAAGGKNDLGLLVNWEVDLWGRIHRTIEASGAAAEASAADLAAITLSTQAQVVQNYFQLRRQDTEVHLLQSALSAHERSLQLVRNQYAVGVASRGNIAQAQAQLGAAQLQMHNARVSRAQLEHTLANLIGKAPADFSLAAAPIMVDVPDIPPELPANLLKRRPDIAAAERRMAVASAKIGVLQAEAYPSLDLFAGVSIRKGLLGGANLLASIYSGGTTPARGTQASAAYDEVVADYRQSVLNGFREVEDNLAALRILDEAALAQDEALKAARESVRVASNQYQAGLVDYLSLITVQAIAFEHERAALDILSRRLVASVALIKALGGGWNAPAPKATQG